MSHARGSQFPVRGASSLQPAMHDPTGLQADPPSHALPPTVGLRGRRWHDDVTSHHRPLHPSRRVRRPIRSLLPQSLFRRSLEGRRARHGWRNLWRTFHQPLRSALMVPNLPGADRPLAPPPSGSAGGGRQGSLNGRSGAAGLRCWRDLPNDNPRSSAPLALRFGPLVKAAHPSPKKI
jgi:hypothetical protein